MKKIVWITAHYNRFARAWDYALECDPQAPEFPRGVYADTVKEAHELAKFFLGKGNYQIEKHMCDFPAGCTMMAEKF